jgi:hypothetical protein
MKAPFRSERSHGTYAVPLSFNVSTGRDPSCIGLDDYYSGFYQLVSWGYSAKSVLTYLRFGIRLPNAESLAPHDVESAVFLKVLALFNSWNPQRITN